MSQFVSFALYALTGVLLGFMAPLKARISNGVEPVPEDDSADPADNSASKTVTVKASSGERSFNESSRDRLGASRAEWCHFAGEKPPSGVVPAGACNQVELKGFRLDELNGIYKKDPSKVVHGRTSYVHESGNFFAFYCDKLAEWRISVPEYAEATLQGGCRGWAATTGVFLAEPGAGWYETTKGVWHEAPTGHAKCVEDEENPKNPVATLKTDLGDLENPKNPVAILKTDLGELEVELFMDTSPISVSNFIDLAKRGFYNGLHFHRVLPGYIEQFGCPHSKHPHSSLVGTGGPVGNSEFVNLATNEKMKRNAKGHIPDECDATHSNEAGTLSMAWGSQFFINVKNNNFLDCFDKSTSWNHSVFGRVLTNHAAAVAISNVQSWQDNQGNARPVKPIKMRSIVIKMAI